MLQHYLTDFNFPMSSAFSFHLCLRGLLDEETQLQLPVWSLMRDGDEVLLGRIMHWKKLILLFIF